MIAYSGIAVFLLNPIGILRLDDSGLRLVQALDPDPMTVVKTTRALEAAFNAIDSRHVTVREAVAKLPSVLNLTAADLTNLQITDERPTGGEDVAEDG